MKTLVLLAAGTGSRLRPLTDSIPKCMLEVGGQSIVGRLMAHFEEWADQIVVVTGHGSQHLEAHLGSTNYRSRIRTIRNDQYSDTNSLYSVHVARSAWNPSSEVIFSNTDVVFDKGALLPLLASTSDMTLAVESKDCDEEDMRVKVSDDGKIVRVSKEISLEESKGEFTGMARICGARVAYFDMTVSALLRDERMKQKGWYDLAFDHIARTDFPIDMVDVPNGTYHEIDTLSDLDHVLKVYGGNGVRP